MCENNDRPNGAGHWVEDLFPPTFRLSLDELISGSVTSTAPDRVSHGREPATESTAGINGNLFAKLARGISPLDVAAIKNVYERVWLMMRANDSARRKFLHHMSLLCLGQIIRSLAFVCLCVCHRSCGCRNFESNFMKLCTVVWGQKTKIEFVGGSKSDNAFPYFTSKFHSS